MVDFNNESTITTPAADVVKILILQRRNDFLEALEAYNKEKARGIQTDISIVKSRLMSLFLEIQPALRRTYSAEDYEELQVLIDARDEQEIIRAFIAINTWLDDKKLIRIDTRKQYDRTIAENENKNYKV